MILGENGVGLCWRFYCLTKPPTCKDTVFPSMTFHGGTRGPTKELLGPLTLQRTRGMVISKIDMQQGVHQHLYNKMI